MKKILRDFLLIAALSCLLLLLAEGGLRGLRLLRGEPAATRVERFYGQMRQVLGLYQSHPFTNTGARRGASVRAFERTVSFNSFGYRSPERPFAKNPGSRRVLCAGGSTTFDIGAAEDGSTWPAWLEAGLRGKPGSEGGGIEVWNAGFPGWTSAENLISFALRDGDLRPDLVVFYQGINDLQPASHAPFDREYVGGHAAESRLALGIGMPSIAWSERSLLLEAARAALGQPTDPWRRLTLPSATGERRTQLPPEALATFERNVGSLIALARARGSQVLLVTQSLRLRQGAPATDRNYLAGWLQGLEPATAAGELERLNDILRQQAGPGVELADAAREIDWRDEDFSDPMHTTAAGSRKLADYLIPRVAALLARGM